MADTTSFPMLIDLAQNATDEAAKQLQTLAKARSDAQGQLEMLQSYRQDYAVRMQQAAQGGLSASNYHNFRQFIATLDEAIAQQNTAIVQLDARLEDGRQQWQAEKRRLSSFETLQERHMVQQRYLRDKVEQRLNDETSINLYLRLRRQH